MSQVTEWTTDLKEIHLRGVEPKGPTAANGFPLLRRRNLLTWHTHGVRTVTKVQVSFANRQSNGLRFTFRIQFNCCCSQLEQFLEHQHNNADKTPTHSMLFMWARLGHIRGIDRTPPPPDRSPDRAFNFNTVVFLGAPLSHSRGRPDIRPSSRGHRWCPSHAAPAPGSDHKPSTSPPNILCRPQANKPDFSCQLACTFNP